MQEKYILANNLNANELCRSLAKNNVNTLGLRIVNSLEFAEICLNKSNISLSKQHISRMRQASLIYSFLNKINYFQSASFNDALNLADAINLIRLYCVENNDLTYIKKALLKGKFSDKNSAIIEVLNKYLDKLKLLNLIDTPGLIKYVIDNAKPIYKAEIITIKEFKYSPLEEQMFVSLSNNNCKNISFKRLFENSNEKVKQINFVEAYGSTNEIEHIIADIFKNHKVDKSVIAVAKPEQYVQLIYDMCKRYDIDVCFSCGLSITNSTAAKLLKLLLVWDGAGQHGIDCAKELFLSSAIDWNMLIDDKLDFLKKQKIAEFFGQLQLNCNKQYNDDSINNYLSKLNNDINNGDKRSKDEAKEKLELINYVDKIRPALEKGIFDFLKNYTYIRQGELGSLDEAALCSMIDIYDTFYEFNADKSFGEIADLMLKQNIWRKISKEGCLFVTNLEGLFSCARENIYICGLSADEFPGNPRENYLLLDEDLENLNRDCSYLPSSKNKIKQNIDTFENCLKLVKCISNSITLSYSSYDLASLKNKNASSTLLSFFDNEKPNKDFYQECKHANYFDEHLSASSYIGKNYTLGQELGFVNLHDDVINEDLLDRKWSATEVENYFLCPRKFYLLNVLKLPETEKHDVFEVIDAASLGSLAHKMMEILSLEKIDNNGKILFEKSEFLKKCEDAFDEYLLTVPGKEEIAKQREKKSFINMMDTAFDVDKSILNNVLAKEIWYSGKHYSGVRLHGYPDRVEKNSDGTKIVVDFKTSRSPKQKEADVKTCLQTMIYAWLISQKNDGIKEFLCEYRMLRLGTKISCFANEDSFKQLDELIETFAEALKNKKFPRNPGSNNTNCTYCTMADICNWHQDCEQGGKHE